MAYGQPPADFEITVDLVRRLIQSQFPALANLPVAEADLGWDNAMFRVGKDLAARLPRHKSGIELLRNEITFLPQLSLTLPAPIPIHVCEPSDEFPAPWTIVPWLPGEPADLHPPHPSEASTLATFLHTLHQPAPTNAPLNEYRGVPLVNIQARRHLSENPIEPHLTPHLQKMWQLALATPVSGESVWIHGDLHPLNVLTQDGNFSAVLDWGDLTSGDPASDYARFYMLFSDPMAILAATSDADIIRRSQGWAIHFGVTHLLHGSAGQPRHGEIGRKTLETLAQAPINL